MKNAHEVGRKNAGIDFSGRKALRNKPEEIISFPGFGHESQKKIIESRFNVALLFSPEGQREIKERVTDRLKIIAGENNLKFITAGIDFPLHSTVGEGEFIAPGLGKPKEEIFSEMKHNNDLKEIIEPLKGLEITYKYVLADKGNVLLTATEIPEQLLETREKIANFYKDKGLKALKIENLLHISLGRISEFPALNKPEALKKYEKEIIALRHEISKNPIKLKVEEISAASLKELLRK